MSYPLLDKIDSPADLKKLPLEELPQLCSEIREYMIEVCSRNPGHLASSLGAVELIVGMHYVYDAPQDKLIFDVGHQAYAHKILTGRREAFRKLRTKDGISGFPSMAESPYDAFGSGHASNSVSAAVGYAEAARILGKKYHSVALIGDGALTGGLALEALNNAGTSKSDILVIVNDNNISIDAAIGGIHQHLFKITSSSRYNALKSKAWTKLGDRPLRSRIQRWIRSVKSWAVKGSGGDLFEALGFRYFGPIDGNDITQVVTALKKMKRLDGPRVLHCITTKGKGYAPAEGAPQIWHAPGRFDPESGERIVSNSPSDRWQDVFGEVLCSLAQEDNRVVGVTPAMASGCGMSEFASKFPGRFFDVGIEEEHAVTFSAGLAAAGLKPFCNIYSTFSQRAYDEIIHDVALQALPVVLCLDRAGVVGEDGATHQGMFDIAAYRAIPGCTISAPSDEVELKNLMYTALHTDKGPFIIRYPRGCAEGAKWKEAPFELLEIGKAAELRHGDTLAIVATGPCVRRALYASEDYDGRVGVYDFRFVKPLDKELLKEISQHYKAVLTIEDGSLIGGLYGAVCEFYESIGAAVRVDGLGAPDQFIAQDTQAAQRVLCGIDSASIARKISELL